MPISQKHYEAVARVLSAHADGNEVLVFKIANDLGTEFKADNANFDKLRFMRACGFNQA